MLISKKKWDGLQEQLSLLKTQVTHTGEEVSAQAADWSEKLNAMKSAVSRHETAMEDMLESWEEWQEKLEAQEARRAESEKNSATVFLRREKALVKLLTERDVIPLGLTLKSILSRNAADLNLKALNDELNQVPAED